MGVMGSVRKRLAGWRFKGAFSFVFIYSWYDAYWRHFEDSPAAASLGALAGLAETLVSFAVIAGVAASLVLPWPRLVEQKRPLKILLHVCAFFPFFLLPLFPVAGAVIALSVIGGFCIGAVMARSLYTLFFEIMDIHPARVTVVGYVIIQAYVHLSDIVPLVSIPPLYYGLSAVTLLAGLALSFTRDDNAEIKRRRVLPENHFRIADTWQILAMITLLQVCLSLYGTVLFPQTAWPGAYAEALNIIPDIVMLSFLWIFGRKLTLTGLLIAFLSLFACTVGSFLILEENARIPMQMFMEPAYRFVDLLFVWILVVVFYTYGRYQFGLKAGLAVFFAVRFCTLVAFEALFTAVPPTDETAFFVLIPVFLASLLLPAAQMSVKNMEARRAYAEEQQGPEVALPHEREDVTAACADLARTLPENVTLTEQEQAALCYLIDGQDADVTAYFMELSPRRVRELWGAVFQKFEVKSSHELIKKLGAVQAGAGERKSREEIFDRYKLTERERQIADLLLSATPAKNIARELDISVSTANFHSNNLYRKLNIQTRAELFTLFAETVPGTKNIETES